VRTVTSDDLEYIRSRIPTYEGYEDELLGHESDKRVRAILGEALSDAQVRFAGNLDASQAALCDEMLNKCMFTDQSVIRRFDHAKAGDPILAALLAADRALVDLEEEVMNASSPTEFAEIMQRIRDQFARRSEPAKATG
jgi:hypothetical protein